MSLISDDERIPALESLIASPEACVTFLEPLYQQQQLSEHYTLVLGVSLMLPPVADMCAALEVFSRLLTGKRHCEAAVWCMYVYHFCPTNTTFVEHLEACSTSAEAEYMRAEYAVRNANLDEFVDWIDRSLALRWFPNNIRQKVRLDGTLTKQERQKWVGFWQSRVIDRKAEYRLDPHTSDELLQQCWEEYILGTHMSSVVWESLSSKLRQLTRD